MTGLRFRYDNKVEQLSLAYFPNPVKIPDVLKVFLKTVHLEFY